jgi:hypothetical protein
MVAFISLLWSLEAGKLHPVSEMVIVPSELDVELDVGGDGEFDVEFDEPSGVLSDVALQDISAALAGTCPFCIA